ncbi:hypothetical protein OG921_16060 [Aldersonia sp. NBC_00410]|uniref:hypothetical protein n=1 Tax=Aldersonia sp. NBC_00410 TaxID=2975954 RepID=UPI00225B7AC1|nr:hypothetical protein [Aldersonia sp. NBC_00410]MCX5044682.1 hypothetical protein [Aldersonia sp. NBC_00410]
MGPGKPPTIVGLVIGCAAMLTFVGCEGTELDGNSSTTSSAEASSTPSEQILNQPLEYNGETRFASLTLPPLPELPLPDSDDVGVFEFGGSWVGTLRLRSACTTSEGHRKQNQPPLWRFVAQSPMSDDVYWPKVGIDRSTLETTSVPIQGKIVFEDTNDNLIEASYVDTAGQVWGLSQQGVSQISDDRRSISFSGITYNEEMSSARGSRGSMTVRGTIKCADPMPTTLPTRWTDVPWN